MLGYRKCLCASLFDHMVEGENGLLLILGQEPLLHSTNKKKAL